MSSLFFADLVREFTHAGGGAALALEGALPGHRRFGDVVPAGAPFHYAIAGVADPAGWEIGRGAIDASGRLARTPAVSSAGGGAVDFAPGLKTVALVAAAAWHDLVQALLDRPAGSDVAVSAAIRAANEAPSSWPLGLSHQRTGAGFPLDGAVATLRHPDDHALQLDMGFAGAAQRIAVRHGRGGIWSPWDGGRTPAAPALLNGWSNYAASYAAAGYQRDLHGRVFLEGTVKGGTAAAYTPLFVLPPGYRPALYHMLSAATNSGTGTINVTPFGEVRFVSGGTSYVSLTGVNFLADQ